MPTARKLPSGSWRCQVYSHSIPIYNPDGTPAMDKTGKQKQKRIYESFTSTDSTKAGKKEAEFMAVEYARQKEHRKNIDRDITFKEGLKQYMASKKNVLSPSTLKEYERMSEKYYAFLDNRVIAKISNVDIQKWVNAFSESHSPKTTRNAYGLLCAVFTMLRYKDSVTNITMPQTVKPQLYTPSDSDIKTVLAHVKGTYLETAIYLAAFGPMRRGEICPLELSDIDGTQILVSKSMVKGPDKKWHIKAPKTYSGYRCIEFPQYVIDVIKANAKGDRLVPLTPDTITKRFRDVIIASNVPNFRFHDLRHYGASILHAIGIPDEYIIKRGGWSTDNVMKSIYRDTISEESVKINQKITSHFETMQHDMQHK